MRSEAANQRHKAKIHNKNSLKKKVKPYHDDGEPAPGINYWTSIKYKVTLHAIRRFSERVLGTDYDTYHVDSDEQDMIARCIVGNLDFELDSSINGIFPFLDDYRIVITQGRVITIKE